MKWLDRYFFGSVDAARPYLLVKGFLFLLAFDCFIDLVPHGGRYGVGDFNVAHFRWLDAIQPTPSPAIYLGTIFLIGLLALTIALSGHSRWALGALAALYTYGWAMSQLDSYQHHYLLTLALALFPAFPLVSYALFGKTGEATSPEPASESERATDESAEEQAAAPSRPGRSRRRKKRGELRAERKVEAKRAKASASASKSGASAWAYHLACVSFGIVYLFTAFAKSEPQWRSGHALRQIAPGRMEPFRVLFVDRWEMFSEKAFWELMGTSVILVQIVIFAGYACAPLIDRPSRLPKIVCAAALFAALSFHVGAEYLELQIGWFSYYMIVAALVVLVPGPVVSWVARGLTAPLRLVAKLVGDESVSRPAVIAIAATSGAVVYAAGRAADLPGATTAAVCAALVAVLVTAASLRRGLLSHARAWAGATCVAALALWASITFTDVRYDFYRFVGGDMKRRGELEASLEAYEKANRYAPEDANRHRQEDDVRLMLGMPPRWHGR